MARASATRCCWPPESVVGMRSPRPDSPTISSASSMRGEARRSARGRPKPTLRATVRWGNRAQSWNTMPMRRRSGGTRTPGPVSVRSPTTTVPASGTLQAGDDAQQGGLAAAARAQQRQRVAGGDLHVDALQHRHHAVEGLGDARHPDRPRDRAQVHPAVRAPSTTVTATAPSPAGAGAASLTARPRPVPGRSVGNRTTSRMECTSASSIVRRSMPMPRPTVGGRP